MCVIDGVTLSSLDDSAFNVILMSVLIKDSDNWKDRWSLQWVSVFL